MDAPRKRGRPKGSKDKTRLPEAPRRGRPPKEKTTDTRETGSIPTTGPGVDSDADDEFEFDDDGVTDQADWDALDRDIHDIYSSIRPRTPEAPSNGASFEQLCTAAKNSQKLIPRQSLNLKTNGMRNPEQSEKSAEKSAWFKQPKYMANWLYRYFNKTIRPMITQKDNRGRLIRPPTFTGTSPSFWIHPPEPTFALSQYSFDPITIYRPRIFLWLPHFFVDKLFCPNCGNNLEKNGALTPRRIVDTDSNFYIVSWAYYCRSGCKGHFHGWSQRLFSSLPRYLQLAFPAILSQKSGVSQNVMNQLRVGNQHKMGPSGVRSLLLESHTLRFGLLQAQYLEAVFEMVRGRQIDLTGQLQSKLDAFLTEKISGFGDFGDSNGYAGFVLSERYLASMLNKAIEKDEADANQHTACQPPDQLAMDDSHKINKHIAKVDGEPVFGALWTCMNSRGIRAQALTLTKSHEERIGPLEGIANSAKLYGFDEPEVVYTDDPLKDKRLIYAAFPSLAKNLAPAAAPRGLESLQIPKSVKVQFVSDSELVDKILCSFTATLDDDKDTHLCMSVDAEWNESRKTGVSILQIAPHSEDIVFLIPVHGFKTLPASLLRLLISDRVFKIGSKIKADLTRLRNQFSQLQSVSSFNVIDLKEYAIDRGVIGRKDAGGLDVLVEKVLGKYLPKDPAIRRCEDWERKDLHQELKHYAALDVVASKMVFEHVTKSSPLHRVQFDTAPGTRVSLRVQEGGEVAAYGRISPVQATSFQGIRIAIPSKTRVMVDIDDVRLPSVAAVLHLLPSTATHAARRTKSGSYTLGQLKEASADSTFSVVSPVHLLEFDTRSHLERQNLIGDFRMCESTSNSAHPQELRNQFSHTSVNEDESETEAEDDSTVADPGDESNENAHALMLEAHASVSKGKRKEQDPTPDNILEVLRRIVDSENLDEPEPELTRIKKDLFHAFHMLTINEHGLRGQFFRALRDHLMRWDPTIRKTVDEACRKHFGITFDTMLERNPDWVKRRTPRYVPAPRIIVPAIEHVFNSYGNALDAQTGSPLFSDKTWRKANAVLDLARQGYLSDIQGVQLYDKDSVDQYGLWKYTGKRGTNKTEGGPHGDIYRKFGALHAGPRLTVNSLTDHRTWFNLQANAKHVHKVDWDYHDSLALVNRTSFLLNYLSGIVTGAGSYSEWLNGDLYEQTTETFGICPVPESLRLRLQMEPYNDQTRVRFEMHGNNDWLRRRQGVALPILPPSTPEARQYFFKKIRAFATNAVDESKHSVDYAAFAQEWNRTADGKARHYITTEVLISYAKSWKKNNNSRASEELISSQLKVVEQTRDIFAAPHIPFPKFLTGIAESAQPSRGMLEMPEDHGLPFSISTELAVSRPLDMFEPMSMALNQR
ncbi:hypothetical protein GGX14DRAFT_580474 [Mycena pura]|uniref:3'-5' exonuclease n=1 Tax=Mycena pura TaxID=153505 RepID=A0AAD6UQA8_9AGAR|nr:hypothetical protein GGX14DRAFT_580474 [Mycena pura]